VKIPDRGIGATALRWSSVAREADLWLG